MEYAVEKEFLFIDNILQLIFCAVCNGEAHDSASWTVHDILPQAKLCIRCMQNDIIMT